jgi:hypothetical protein
MEAVSANLNWFLQPIGDNLTKPQKKFLRDGSTGQLVKGYWLIELYASVSRKNPVPILMEPFSHEQPLCPGQNPIILYAVHWVFELTEKRGVLVVDRGGNARALLEDWIDHDYRFVVRMRGDRDLPRFYEGFGGAIQTVQALRQGQWVRVEARRVLAYYARRWEREEGIRFLKSEVSLERIRTFSWTAPDVHRDRLVLLCVLVMLYLSWMLERKPNLAERLIALGQPLPDEPDFLLYRMLTGLTEAITACIYAGRALP